MADVRDYPPYLDYPKEQKKQTNADKIRKMSDEELAKLISDACPPRHKENRCVRFFQKGDGCQGCWLDWLKQEVK